MNRIIQEYNLKPGDEIIIAKQGFEIINHHLLYVGFNNKNTDWFIENTPSKGVQLISAEQLFSDKVLIKKINPFTGSEYVKRQMLRKALRSVGQSYDLFNFNCEHFTTGLRTGNQRSKQLENWGLGFLAIILINELIIE